MRRTATTLLAITSTGIAVLGAGASTATASPPAQSSASVVASQQWYRSADYSDSRKCDEQRRVKYARGFPTDPTAGCYRWYKGYYFYWWQ
jgi:hypothetical protein